MPVVRAADLVALLDAAGIRTDLYFDVSGVAGLGGWTEKRDRIAERIWQLGVGRVLYGSDGAVGENTPEHALAAFRHLQLSVAEFRAIEGNVAA